VHVRSTVGRGSEFELVLPASAPEPGSALPSDRQATAR
jgi:hypothetical protein